MRSSKHPAHPGGEYIPVKVAETLASRGSFVSTSSLELGEEEDDGLVSSPSAQRGNRNGLLDSMASEMVRPCPRTTNGATGCRIRMAGFGAAVHPAASPAPLINPSSLLLPALTLTLDLSHEECLAGERFAAGALERRRRDSHHVDEAGSCVLDSPCASW
jgi:hypothetical protein